MNTKIEKINELLKSGFNSPEELTALQIEITKVFGFTSVEIAMAITPLVEGTTLQFNGIEVVETPEGLVATASYYKENIDYSLAEEDMEDLYEDMFNEDGTKKVHPKAAEFTLGVKANKEYLDSKGISYTDDLDKLLLLNF